MPFRYRGPREKCILRMLLVMYQLEPNTEHEHTIRLRCLDREKDEWIVEDTFHFTKVEGNK